MRRKTASLELDRRNRLLQEGSLSMETLIRQKTEELRIRNLKMEEKIREAEYISNIDPLTGIANRKKFEEGTKQGNYAFKPLRLSAFNGHV